jgi:hypothetical protein
MVTVTILNVGQHFQAADRVNTPFHTCAHELQENHFSDVPDFGAGPYASYTARTLFPESSMHVELRSRIFPGKNGPDAGCLMYVLQEFRQGRHGLCFALIDAGNESAAFKPAQEQAQSSLHVLILGKLLDCFGYTVSLFKEQHKNTSQAAFLILHRSPRLS